MEESYIPNKVLYSQILMLNPDGLPMCYIDEKRFKWYMKRNLAEVVEKNPLTIRLKFQPSGNGKSHNLYYLTKIKNKCVVCGTNKNLTKHHIVPYLYRKFFPDEYKEHNSYDVVLMCRGCHDEYEYYATLKKKNILKKYGISPKIKKYIIDDKRVMIKKAASALKRCKNIPIKRRRELEKVIVKFFKQDKISQMYIDKGCNLNVLHKDFRLKQEGKEVMNKVENIDKFIIEWRKHFLKIMSPKFMPEYWDINKIETNWDMHKIK